MRNTLPEVLIVSTDMNGKGGVASVITTYVKGGLQNNYNIRFLVTHAGVSKFKNLFVFIFSILKLLPYLLSRNCKIFHIHTASRSSFWRKSVIVWLGKLFNKKIILHLHGAEFVQFYIEESGLLLKWYIRTTFNEVDRVVVLSSQWKENIQNIASRAIIDVIFNPISVGNIELKDNDKNIILFLGRVGERKGFWDILNALALVKKTHSNYVFMYGGDGELDKADKIINEQGLDVCTEYLGWVSGEKKQDILNKSSIYLLPSYNEGLPMGILEAMASKVPVISCPVGGIPDVIIDGVNGLLVQPGDADALSKAIVKLLDSKTLRDDIANNAFNDVINKYSVDVIVPQIEALYKKILEK